MNAMDMSAAEMSTMGAPRKASPEESTDWWKRKADEFTASAEIAAAFKDLGFAYVTLDLLGYRTGSMNETLPEAESKR